MLKVVMSPNNKMPEERYRFVVWNYFKLHANQRLIMFRFYIVFFSVFALVVGHLISEFHFKSSYQDSIVIVLSIVFILITCIFWCLDSRNRYLIHNSEDYFRSYEKAFEDNVKVSENRFLTNINTARIFIRENQDKTNGYCKIRHTLCFRLIFIIGILLAFIFIGFATYSLYHHDDNVYHQIHIINNKV